MIGRFLRQYKQEDNKKRKYIERKMLIVGPVKVVISNLYSELRLPRAEEPVGHLFR